MPERLTIPTLGCSALGGLGDVGRRDADVALAWADHAGTVRTEQPCAREVAHELVVGTRLVLGGDALGDAHDEGDPGSCRFEDRRRGGLRWHGDERGRRAGGGDRLGHGVEHGDPLDVLAALAGRDAGDDLGSVVAVAQAVEAALPAGQPWTSTFVSASTKIAMASRPAFHCVPRPRRPLLAAHSLALARCAHSLARVRRPLTRSLARTSRLRLLSRWRCVLLHEQPRASSVC